MVQQTKQWYDGVHFKLIHLSIEVLFACCVQAGAAVSVMVIHCRKDVAGIDNNPNIAWKAECKQRHQKEVAQPDEATVTDHSIQLSLQFNRLQHIDGGICRMSRCTLL